MPPKSLHLPRYRVSQKSNQLHNGSALEQMLSFQFKPNG